MLPFRAVPDEPTVLDRFPSCDHMCRFSGIQILPTRGELNSAASSFNARYRYEQSTAPTNFFCVFLKRHQARNTGRTCHRGPQILNHSIPAVLCAMP